MTDVNGTQLPPTPPEPEAAAQSGAGVSEASSGPSGPDPSEGLGRWVRLGRWSPRRRRPAPRAHFFWRFVYPAVILAAAVAVFLLAREGGRAVLHQQVDRVQETVRFQPDEPGYLELVGATPTLLALHTDNGELAGVTFMARTGIDAGGGIVLLSADLFVEPAGASSEEGEFLGGAYAEGGLAAVERLAEGLFGFGFDEVIEVSTEALASRIQPTGPLPYLVLDDLVAAGADGEVRVVLEAGQRDLLASDAAAVYAFRNPEEADVNRLERQKALWESWLGVVGQAEDPAPEAPPFDDGLFSHLVALSAGTALIEIPPMQTMARDPGAAPSYELGDEGAAWLRERSLGLVPWPRQPESFFRPSVQLLDSTGDPSARDALVEDIVSAGGVITVIGNAPRFGAESTRFAYHRAELVTDPIANTIAYELGVDMDFVEPYEGTTDLADITVTVGLSPVAQ